MRTFALLLLGCLAFAGAGAQTPPGGAKRSMERSAFLDFAEGRMTQYYCDRDGTYMKCLGVDIRSDRGRCAELVRQGAAQCRQRLSSSLPASIPEGPEFNRHAGEFSRCLGHSVIAVSGKPFGEVDKCLAQGSDPKKGK
jgi:hypothetical protein